MDGRQCATQVDPDQCGFLRAQRSVFLEPLLEGLALQELGPDPYMTVMSVRAVDHQDVLVPHPRQPAGFGDEAVSVRVGAGLGSPPELEGHFPI